MTPYCSGVRPRGDRYSGRIDVTISDETSVNRLTRPSRRTVVPTVAPAGPALRPLTEALLALEEAGGVLDASTSVAFLGRAAHCHEALRHAEDTLAVDGRVREQALQVAPRRGASIVLPVAARLPAQR